MKYTLKIEFSHSFEASTASEVEEIARQLRGLEKIVQEIKGVIRSFSPGDVVRVTGNGSSEDGTRVHGFGIGTIGIVSSVNDDGELVVYSSKHMFAHYVEESHLELVRHEDGYKVH